MKDNVYRYKIYRQILYIHKVEVKSNPYDE